MLNREVYGMKGDDSWSYGTDANGRWGKIANPGSFFGNVYRQLSSLPYANTQISKQLFAECDVFLSYQERER